MSYNDFRDAYMECLIWQASDEDVAMLHEASLDLSSDFSPEALAEIEGDCQAFYHDNDWRPHWSDEQAGHDFCLTRNGHGTGFWDRYCGDHPGAAMGKALTEAAKAYGEQQPYYGDDGKLYI